MTEETQAAPSVTPEHFETRVGRPPQDDDMHRSNCPDSGRIGHSFCGWDAIADMPVFITGNRNPPRRDQDAAA